VAGAFQLITDYFKDGGEGEKPAYTVIDKNIAFEKNIDQEKLPQNVSKYNDLQTELNGVNWKDDRSIGALDVIYSTRL